MRLDKYLCESLELTRTQAIKVIKSGVITIDEIVVKRAATKVLSGCVVKLNQKIISPIGEQYFMLNKPAGYVCANSDALHPTVFMLLDEPKLDKLHVVGRLDADTTGLVLITNNGKWSHKVRSPRTKCGKKYLVSLAEPLTAAMQTQLESGILLRNETTKTTPAIVEVLTPTQCYLTIFEGKYHQVKRMFAAVGNKVETLHREAIGSIKLDNNLAQKQYRALTAAEIASII